LEYDDSHTGLLCFEEPENGIHPFRIATMSSLLKDLTTDFSDESLPLRQAIVNTHSPILVKELSKWNKDLNVSIWMSQMSNVVIYTSVGKIKMSITKILPVEKENEFQLKIPYSDEDRRMTLTKVKEYLETTENLQ
jgi:predicted ATP-dependent endonuclease of OLD family